MAGTRTAPAEESKERKLSLPNGHPEAGYVGHDPSFVDGVETFPEEEQKARDEAKQAWEEEVKTVEDKEHEVATKEAQEAEKALKEEAKQIEAAKESA